LPVITAGVDLAAMPKRTALASIEWTDGRAVIKDVICPADDDVIVKAIEQADKTGIDCPLGWPAALTDFVAAHGRANGACWTCGGGSTDATRRPITGRYLATGRRVCARAQAPSTPEARRAGCRLVAHNERAPLR
jgi:hypothetical protein